MRSFKHVLVVVCALIATTAAAAPATAAEAAAAVAPQVAPAAGLVPSAPSPQGPWYTYNLDNQKVMAIKGASREHGAAAIQYTRSGGNRNDEMIWEYETSAPGLVRLKPAHTYSNDGNPHNDMCLAVKGASMELRATIVQARCTYDSINNDVWLMDPSPTMLTAIEFRNQKSNMCIAVRGASDDNGAELIQYTCNGTNNSRWMATNLRTG